MANDKTFHVTLEDTDGSRGWRDFDTGKPTTTSTLEVSADSIDAAKEFAEKQNPGLTATDAKEQK